MWICIYDNLDSIWTGSNYTYMLLCNLLFFTSSCHVHESTSTATFLMAAQDSIVSINRLFKTQYFPFGNTWGDLTTSSRNISQCMFFYITYSLHVHLFGCLFSPKDKNHRSEPNICILSLGYHIPYCVKSLWLIFKPKGNLVVNRFILL